MNDKFYAEPKSFPKNKVQGLPERPGPTALLEKINEEKTAAPQEEDGGFQDLFLSPRRGWINLGSLLALTGYIGQIVCQFLMVSGLWLAHSGPARAMEEERYAHYQHPDPNPSYYYTDEDIETCINAMVAHSTELERVPDCTYLLKPKNTSDLTFRNQAGTPYYAALLPSCSCMAEIHNAEIYNIVGVPALPVTYCLDKSNQEGEFVTLLKKLLSCNDTASMLEQLTHREQDIGGNYDAFKAIIERGRGEIARGADRDKAIADIKSQLRSELYTYQKLARDVFDELLYHTSDLSHAYYKIVFPFCQNNAHWHVGEIWGEKRGIDNYSFTIINHDPYGGGDFSRTFAEDTVRIHGCLAHRLSLPYLTLTPAISPYSKPRQSYSDSISCGPIMVDELFKVILSQNLDMLTPYGYGAIPLRKQQIEMVKAVQHPHTVGTVVPVSSTEATKFVQKNMQWVNELEGLSQVLTQKEAPKFLENNERWVEELDRQPQTKWHKNILFSYQIGSLDSGMPDKKRKRDNNLERRLQNKGESTIPLNDQADAYETLLFNKRRKISNKAESTITDKSCTGKQDVSSKVMSKHNKKRKRNDSSGGIPLSKRYKQENITGESGRTKELNFYRDAAHPLTLEFWKERDLSERLQTIRPDIERLKEVLLRNKGDLTENVREFIEENWERYREILNCSQCAANPAQKLEDIHCRKENIMGLGAPKVINNGHTGNGVIIFPAGKSTLVAIKEFKNTEKKHSSIQEGLEELLYSLLAHDLNPSPSKFKIARIYDAVLCPQNSLSLIMEGANAYDIHHFLRTGIAEEAVKACAHYLAKFHIGNYQKDYRSINKEKYVKHQAEAHQKISYNPLREENEITLKVGRQQLDLNEVNTKNIIRLLPEDEQNRFANLVNFNRNNFEGNCGKIFRNLDDSGNSGFYFLTKTHGDGHGNNFFYNDDDSLLHKERKIDKDSFYRISMIDYASIIRTYGGIGDPAEDVGRFLGSLWDWAARPAKQEHQQYKSYETISGLQKSFLESYLHQILFTGNNIIPGANRENFKKVFEENWNFYKFRFYKAIFNSQKDKETKLRVLKSWIKENEHQKSLQDNLRKNGARRESLDRPWIPVEGKIIHWLPNPVERFIESKPEASKSYLTSLWKKFNDGSTRESCSRTATLTSTIAGMGGIGKTSLALEYAHEALDNKGYNLIYWLLSETETSLVKGYRDLWEQMGGVFNEESDNQVIEMVKEKICNMGKCLLIYDNVPDPEFLINKVPQTDNIDVLITSRCSQGWETDPVNLGLFSPKDSAKYLIETIGIEDNAGNQEKVRELAGELGYLPLALSHAAHYIKFTNGQGVPGNLIDGYIKKFKEGSVQHFEKRQDPFTSNTLEMNYENLIGKTYSMSAEKISDLAKELIIYCAYLDSDIIPEDIFVYGLKGKNKEEIKEAFEQLFSFSLIKRTENIISIHRLLQHVILKEQEGNVIKEKTTDKLREIFALSWLRERSDFMKIKNQIILYNKDILYLVDRLNKNKLNLKSFIKNCEKMNINNKTIECSTNIYGRLKGTILSTREEIFKRKNRFLKNSSEESDAISLLEKEIKSQGIIIKYDGIYKIILSLLNRNCDQVDRLNIAKVFSRAGSLEEAERFITDIKELNTTDMNGACQVSILQALEKIHVDQRRDVAVNAKKLITKNMEKDAAESMITYFGKIDKTQRQKFTKAVKMLVTDRMSVYGQSQIIKALAKIESDQQQSIAETTQMLVTNKISGYGQVVVIESLAKIGAGQRQNVAQAARLLVTDQMSVSDQVVIIESLAKVRADQRQNVAQAVKLLITDRMPGFDQAHIIGSLAKIGAGQRQNVAQAARLLVTDKINGCGALALANVEGGQRQDVAQAAQLLLTDKMSGANQVRIIEALADVEGGQRQDVAQAAQLLLTDKMSGANQVRIIEALANVEGGQRQDVAQAAQLLLTDKMSGANQVRIIEALANVEGGQRQDVAQAAQLLLTDKMDRYDQIRIIEALEKGSDAHCTNIIKELGNLNKPQHFQSGETTTSLTAAGSRENIKSCSTKTQFAMDLGSSGVQLGGFRINIDKQIIEEEVFNKKERILLQAAIKNSILPKEVQETTVETIKKLLSEAEINPESTKVIGYATAWARAAENSHELIKAIQSSTKVTVNIIDQHVEGEIGFHATLATLRSLLLNKKSFLYQTEAGRTLLLKISSNDMENCIMPESIISWDIGGGSMQLAKQDKGNKTVDVIGSTDSSTLFANEVIALKKTFFGQEIEEISVDTPNPLSLEQVNAAINLSKKKAGRFIGTSFLESLKLQGSSVFGIGLMHRSNRLYINKLLGINLENFYLKPDLEKAINLLVDKGDSEIAMALGIKEADARNRLTSMILVLGFMEHIEIERINTIDVTGFTGVFFIDLVGKTLKNTDFMF